MGKYQFEYTDKKYLIKVFIVFVTVQVISVLIVLDNASSIGSIWYLTTCLTSLVLFFVFARKSKKRGSATINDSFTEIYLPDRHVTIHYAEVKRYKIEHFRGRQLNVWLKNGFVFELNANYNFCNPAGFDQFVLAFDKFLTQHNRIHNVQVEKAPSMFLRAWVLPFLIILSAGLILVAAVVIYLRKTVPSSLYLSCILIGSLWTGYFAARKKVKSEL